MIPRLGMYISTAAIGRKPAAMNPMDPPPLPAKRSMNVGATTSRKPPAFFSTLPRPPRALGVAGSDYRPSREFQYLLSLPKSRATRSRWNRRGRRANKSAPWGRGRKSGGLHGRLRQRYGAACSPMAPVIRGWKYVRSALHRAGLRFRKHVRPVAGLACIPDVLFMGARLALFIDGCYWHGCPVASQLPSCARRMVASEAGGQQSARSSKPPCTAGRWMERGARLGARARQQGRLEGSCSPRTLERSKVSPFTGVRQARHRSRRSPDAVARLTSAPAP